MPEWPRTLEHEVLKPILDPAELLAPLAVVNAPTQHLHSGFPSGRLRASLAAVIANELFESQKQGTDPWDDQEEAVDDARHAEGEGKKDEGGGER